MTVFTSAHSVGPDRDMRRYAAILTPGATRQIQRLVAPFGLEIERCEPESFLEHLDLPDHVCAIFDPAQLAPEQIDEAVTRLRAQPRPAIVYAGVTPTNARDAMRVAAEAGAAVAFQSVEDNPAMLVRTIVSAGHPADAAVLLRHLDPVLSTLPRQLRSAITAMFAIDAAPESPSSLAQRVGASRRSLDRWVARAGFRSTRLLTLAPPVLRAMRLLRETELTNVTVTTMVGITSSRRLRDCTITLMGLTPAEVRQDTTPIHERVDQIAAQLLGPVADAAARS